MSNRKLVIVGTGGHSTSVANVAISSGKLIAFFIDKTGRKETHLGYPVLDSVRKLHDPFAYDFAIAIGDNFIRERVANEIQNEFSGAKFPVLVHSSAVICDLVQIGEGSVVMPSSVVGPNSTLGAFCIVNTRASIDHDSVMNDFASIAPGVTLGGSVTLGRRSAVSIGATVKHGITIGSDAVVGGQSYVNKDVEISSVSYGIPAKSIRLRTLGEPYLK